eukprot:CAMPEP_0172202030 /NCGR_PEP_ID=MMETSP1050-20130122/30384_1 /TAXON_ID=233186 /ORGANISM="Cryptomonas curvata, Strain CCAP979/52" /LENGTH=51 /DNA_ID=CAMNT_0012879853 /DNA_START=260 /DNA_END=412 /DNA_ORIENTATION=-
MHWVQPVLYAEHANVLVVHNGLKALEQVRHPVEKDPLPVQPQGKSRGSLGK